MSTPRINPNDPKWSDYVLGQLDEADRDAVERLLESSDDARALVAELKATMAALDDALASEALEQLTPAQRAAVRREADAGEERQWLQMPTRWAWSLGAVSAAILAAVTLQLSRSQPSVVPDDNRVASAPITSPPTVAAPSAAVPSTESAPTVASTPSPAARIPVGQIAQGEAGAPPAAVSTPPAAVAAGQARINLPDPAAKVQQELAQPGRLAESVTVAAPAPTVDVQNARQSVQFEQGVAGGIGGGVVGGVASGAGARGGGRGGRVGDTANQGRVIVDGLLTLTPGPTSVAAPPPPATPAFRAGSDPTVLYRPPVNAESYARVAENPFVRVAQEPLATFSIDVDTASYSNVRRFLTQGQRPPADAVRIEELINYFSYDYARPSGSRPIAASMHVTEAPWNPAHRLVRFGIKARPIDANRRPASNLVFLIDVSGSMNTPQKLPLVKSGLKMLVDQLTENDSVSMVVYASASGLVLPPTSGNRKDVLVRAIDDLQAGGSTNGGAGIQLAYNQATANFIRGGVNRVILMTDGDFNVGITNQGDLTRLIEDRAKSGVFLSVLGFGMGNLKDSTMERLADMGNGHYAYIDTLNEARKVLVEEMGSTLVTVAKDVKIQVDFNPAKVEAYRLIGYENRALRPEDFNNDLKDAGDMGAGHTVTALFEIVPRGGSVPGPSIDPSVFQPAPRDAAPRDTPAPTSNSNDMLVLRLRYKLPDASASTRMDVPLADRGARFSAADADFRFAASVAAFGMILKNSAYRGSATLGWVLDTATASQGSDRSGYRDEFVSLVQRAMALSRPPEPFGFR